MKASSHAGDRNVFRPAPEAANWVAIGTGPSVPRRLGYIRIAGGHLVWAGGEIPKGLRYVDLACSLSVIEQTIFGQHPESRPSIRAARSPYRGFKITILLRKARSGLVHRREHAARETAEPIVRVVAVLLSSNRQVAAIETERMKVGGRSFERKVVLIKRCVRGPDAVPRCANSSAVQQVGYVERGHRGEILRQHQSIVRGERRWARNRLRMANHRAQEKCDRGEKSCDIFHVLAFLVELRSG